MPLPIELEKAIADEKVKRGYGNEHDLAELIEKEAKKITPDGKEKGKEEDKAEVEKKDEKPIGEVATELLAKRLGHKPKKKEDDEKKEKADTDKALEKKEDSADSGGGDSTDDKSATESDTKEEEKPKKAKVAKKPDIDPIEIASAAAARTATAFMESHEASRAKAAKEPEGKGAEDLLSEEEKGELEVFREMAKAPQFKDLPRQYIAYLKKAEEYQRQWEKDHPTDEFDPDANDHDAFYKKHQPKYAELEYKKAIVRMESKGATNKELEDLKVEQKRLKAESAARELDPVISQTSVGALAEVIKGIDENILKSIEKDGFQKYAEANELEADLIKDVAGRMGPFIAGILQFDDPDGRIPFNEKNPAHIEAVRYLREKEGELLKRPMRERLTDDGKVIVPRGEYFRMTDAQKQSHAYLNTEMLLQLRIAEEAERSLAQYQKEQKKLESLARKRGWVPPSRTENGHKAKAEEAKKEEKPEEIQEETKSPEAGSSSRIDTSGDAKKGVTKDILESTANVLFARR